VEINAIIQAIGELLYLIAAILSALAAYRESHPRQ
jgi:hypothetical protein